MRKLLVAVALVAAGCGASVDTTVPTALPAVPVMQRYCQAEDERQFRHDGECWHIDRLTARALGEVIA